MVIGHSWSVAVAVRREPDHMAVVSIDWVEVANIQKLEGNDTGNIHLVDRDMGKADHDFERGLRPGEAGLGSDSQ